MVNLNIDVRNQQWTLELNSIWSVPRHRVRMSNASINSHLCNLRNLWMSFFWDGLIHRNRRFVDKKRSTSETCEMLVGVLESVCYVTTGPLDFAESD